MNIAVEDVSPCRKRLQIEVPAEKVWAEYDAVLEEFVQAAVVKGFRPGKAPARVVSARYARQIKEEVRDRLVPEGYRAALDQTEINPVAVLEIGDATVDPGRPLVFSILCDVAPDFALPAYRHIAVTSESVPVEEEDVDQATANLLDRFATYEDVERAVEAGDLVRVDFTGTLDGRPLAEAAPAAEGLAAATACWLQAGEEAFLPELGRGLVGAGPGEVKRIEVTFPPDFTEVSLREKAAVYDVTVKQVREKRVPELDEEKLKRLGVESEEALRQRIREELEAHRDASDRSRMKNQIISHLVQATSFDVPESVLQEETRSTVYDMVRDVVRRGAEKTVIEERRDQIFDAASRSAAEKVKIRYILSRIAREENVEISDEEVDRRVAALAQRYQTPVEELRGELQKRGQLDSVRHDIRLEKTLDFLLESANISR